MIMKKALNLVYLALFLLCFCATAQAVTFEWDINTDNPVGYIVYFNEKGDTDTPFNTAPIVHPANQVIVDDVRFIPGVTYEIWATAYNARGESSKSNIIEYSIDPFTPPAENLPVIIDFPSIPATVRML